LQGTRTHLVYSKWDWVKQSISVHLSDLCSLPCWLAGLHLGQADDLSDAPGLAWAGLL